LGNGFLDVFAVLFKVVARERHEDFEFAQRLQRLWNAFGCISVGFINVYEEGGAFFFWGVLSAHSCYVDS